MSWWQVASFVVSNWTMVGLDIESLFYFKADAGFFFLPEVANGASWAGDFHTIGQAWSIGVEIWFYLLAPFLVALRSRWIVLIGLASIVLKSVMPTWDGAYFFFPAQLCFFIAGMLLHRAYVTKSFGKLDRRIGYAALTLVMTLLVFYDWLPKPTAAYVIFAALIPAIPILFDLTRKSRFDIALGNLSYPVYIVHPLIISLVFSMLHNTNVKINEDAIALTIIMAVLVASMILYFVIERPVDEIRQRLAAGVRASPQPETFAGINPAPQI
jgi:peptidoglycan/LPS O-acetylase OafA/YrhL